MRRGKAWREVLCASPWGLGGGGVGRGPPTSVVPLTRRGLLRWVREGREGGHTLINSVVTGSRGGRG